MSHYSVGGARHLWVAYTKPIVLCSSEWAAEHDGDVPTLEEIVSIWDIPPKTHPNYNRKMDLLLCYVDELIPYCVGNDQWGKNTRQYHMMVSTVLINGKQRPMVTAKGEAMCWTIYANCIKKRNLVCSEIKANPKWTIPKFKGKDKSTHPYYDTPWK